MQNRREVSAKAQLLEFIYDAKTALDRGESPKLVYELLKERLQVRFNTTPYRKVFWTEAEYYSVLRETNEESDEFVYTDTVLYDAVNTR